MSRPSWQRFDAEFGRYVMRKQRGCALFIIGLMVSCLIVVLVLRIWLLAQIHRRTANG